MGSNPRTLFYRLNVHAYIKVFLLHCIVFIIYFVLTSKSLILVPTNVFSLPQNKQMYKLTSTQKPYRTSVLFTVSTETPLLKSMIIIQNVKRDGYYLMILTVSLT